MRIRGSKLAFLFLPLFFRFRTQSLGVTCTQANFVTCSELRQISEISKGTSKTWGLSPIKRAAQLSCYFQVFYDDVISTNIFGKKGALQKTGNILPNSVELWLANGWDTWRLSPVVWYIHWCDLRANILGEKRALDKRKKGSKSTKDSRPSPKSGELRCINDWDCTANFRTPLHFVTANVFTRRSSKRTQPNFATCSEVSQIPDLKMDVENSSLGLK